MRAFAHKGRRAGFTLVETLAALAVASSIIVGAATLTHHVAFHFDHGARSVDEAERLALAMERLARDFGAASFVALTPAGASRKQPEERPAPIAFDGSAERLVFVTASAIGARAALEEIVAFSIEPAGGESARLVRRRAPWLGPRAGLDAANAQDAVILLEGRFDMSFVYASIEDGAASWRVAWRGEAELPRLVRLDLRDRETGEQLFPGAEFVLRADAPAACANASAQCLPGKKKEPEAPARRAPT
ncbi:prepilin-type N-terminal cleavage/methylation domain-containing protein [Methylosinus sp. Ce-a6]|uniref:prepilin-type N-terminal cleavage/methylation domain-containing protein n=1 Tax=Methylosinus sp. Ce-a6 TaxID=2172005 RepID=UPI0013568773|nr:prepilin-type N-terminal cleavage/methylation domain-containing protein [Methylosinus sp. Ce-a6]